MTHCPVHKTRLQRKRRQVQCPNPKFVYSLHGYQCLHVENGKQCKTQYVDPQQRARNARIIEKVAQVARPLITMAREG